MDLRLANTNDLSKLKAVYENIIDNMNKNNIEIAKEKNAKYLRLFVVDINKPAINLYLKNGFNQVYGIYEERIDDDFILSEYGFEIEVLR